MVKRKNILPYMPIGNLIQDATGKRVSKSAKVTSAQILEDVTQQLIHKSKLIAENSKRKTIRSKDLNLAYQQLKGDL